MSLAKVRRMHESIRQTAAELIDGFVDAGRCDFTHDYARVFPLRIFMSLVDLPIADVERIRHLAECMTRPNPPMPFGAANRAFYDYMTTVGAARSADQGETLATHVLADEKGRRR